MQLTEHFSLEELIRSEYAIRHGLSNMPAEPHVLKHLHLLAGGLERVRSVLGKPVVITSGYRSPEVNAGVGGSVTPPSAHMDGLAADFLVPGMTPREVCLCLQDHPEIGFDQLIYEGSWVHISFCLLVPRGTVLTAIFKPGAKTLYINGVA
jgi:zinc D-Ala-D-Ala carboxypeptidase